MLAHHTWLQPAPRLACGVFDYDCTSDPPQFSWRSVAASAISAGVTQGVGDYLGGGAGWQNSASLDGWSKFAIDAGSRFIGGTVAQAVTNKGGRVNFGQVAADAFGNALGNSIARGIAGPSQQEQRAAFSQAGSRAMDAEYGIANQNDAWAHQAQQQAHLERAGFIDAGRDMMGAESGVWGAQADFANEAALQNQENMRDREMSRLMGLGSSADSAQPRSRVAGRGDSWAKMARQEYGDERYALALAQANGARSTNLPLGANVQLPDLTGANLRQGGSFIAADAAMRAPRETVAAGVDQSTQQWADNRSLLNAVNREVDRRMVAAGPSGVDSIPGAGPGQVAPLAQTGSSTGFTGYLLDKLDAFQRSPAGHAMQGLPPEGFIIGGAKAGLMWAGRASKAEGLIDSTTAARELLITESRTQAAALQVKYGAMSSEQRLVRLQELAQGNKVLRDAGVEPSYISSALQSFEPGTITTRIAGTEDYGLRFYGGVSGPKSPYLNPTFAAGDPRMLNAVPGGNTMQSVVQWQIRPGTPVLEGYVRSAFGQPGGGVQIYVPNFRQNLLVPGGR